jgi:hypothetical protein
MLDSRYCGLLLVYTVVAALLAGEEEVIPPIMILIDLDEPSS